MTKVRLHLLRVTGDLDEQAIAALFCQITGRTATRGDIAALRRELTALRREEDDAGGG
jgi:hypothetical protein